MIYKKCGLPEASYEKRLRFLDLEKLNARRLRLDVILADKIYHGKAFCANILQRKINARPLAHNSRLLRDVVACKPRYLFFSNRIVEFWNKIPERILLSDENTFKNYIDNL